MFKKLSAILFVFIILTVSSIAAYAGPVEDALKLKQPAAGEKAITDESVAAGESDIGKESISTTASAIAAKKAEFEKLLDNTIKDGNAVNVGQGIIEILISIDRQDPETLEYSTYEKMCALSGNSKYNDVIITIAKYNKDKKAYELIVNTDGKSSWKIGDNQMFSTAIELLNGSNMIKIVAYRTSQMEEAKVENIQVNCFTIKVLKESIINKAIKKTIDISNDIGKSLGIGDIFKNK